MQKRGWKKLLAYAGPGFLVCIAYIDPGNFESDLQSGAQYKYELLWVILVASIAALFIQSLAANLGVVTGKHLAEHCRTEYPRKIYVGLWIITEFAIIACDIPEVIGTAFALNVLFSIPVWTGVLITGCSTFVFLALQHYGARKLEVIITLFVLTMAGCFFIELGYAKPKANELLKGLFVPRLKSSGSTALAVSLLGAMVMPHNLFLHSALVLTREIPRSVGAIRDGCRYYFMESAFALFLAFLINLCIISVSGEVCNQPNLSSENQKSCDNLDLNHASFLLRNVLGSWSSTLYGIALLASGQSSTVTGTYAGQFVMQGFLNLRFKPWLRNLLTRSVAITPSLIVALIGGSAGAGRLIIISSMILSFALPFALVPLIKFTSSKTKMGPHANSWMVAFTTWAIGFIIMAINMYFLISTFLKWLLGGHVNKVASVFIGIIVFSCMLLYLGSIGYLALRTDTEITYLLPPEGAEDNEIEEANELESHGPVGVLPREDILRMQIP
ncbi:hypothetical protein O6H91_01G034000 [Diphasiastrum complanatum]|uniref:Uncharacterized protein n=1 Tax=Diphasiastrum complanatum TaxID=34168 RepID=A0ACC2EPR9_DIPCM|nr:hypothetical protein O6H91_01G034000 [Diphasiastrum complanatum]